MMASIPVVLTLDPAAADLLTRYMAIMDRAVATAQAEIDRSGAVDLDQYVTWDLVASQIPADGEYDLSDDSHRVDLAQIVCHAIAKIIRERSA